MHNRKLIQVIGTMQRHMETPLGSDALAQEVSITRRQLERLFSATLNDTPTHFYLNLRLDRARELLQQTDMSITSVCVACGFESRVISRTYRTRFGLARTTGARRADRRRFHTQSGAELRVRAAIPAAC